MSSFAFGVCRKDFVRVCGEIRVVVDIGRWATILLVLSSGPREPAAQVASTLFVEYHLSQLVGTDEQLAHIGILGCV